MSTMFKARAFSVQKPCFEDWLVDAGHNCRDLPQFSLDVARPESRELAKKLGFDGYHYENTSVDYFVEFLDNIGVDIVGCDPYNGMYGEEADSAGRPVFPEMRNFLLWLLKQDRLDGIYALLRAGMIHLGGHLFPACYLAEGSFSPSLPTSLLGMATLESCLPAAVELLLSWGASPTDVLYPISFNGDYAPTQGCGGLAIADVRDEWCFGDRATNESKLKILELLTLTAPVYQM